jgi:DNA-binding XRE family transcriptional regulator
LLTQNKIQKILLLRRNGFSQQKTAQLANVSRSTIQRIEKRILAYSTPNHHTNDSVTNCFAMITDARYRIPLELRGEPLRRYVEVHQRKQANSKKKEVARQSTESG